MTVFNGGTEKRLKIKTGRKAVRIPTVDKIYKKKKTRSTLAMIILTVGVIHKFALWESSQVC